MEYEFNPSTANKFQFPCKNCGGFLTFQPGMKSLVCQFCGTMNEIEDKQVEIKEIDYKSFISNLSNNAPRTQVATVKCTSCGAESSMKPNVTSDNCPFCGTALVLEHGSLQTEIAPQALLPFKIPQKQSFALFKEWINGLWFAPNGLKKYADNHEKLTGMYIPYWTYDADTYSRYTGERGEYYYVTESYRDSDGNTQTREVQKIRWYSASGSVSHSFDDILTMGSHSLPANYAQELEPWDLHDLAPFNEQYLSGFRAESYQVDVKEGFEIAKQRMDGVIDGLVRQDIGGDTQQVHSINTTYNDITFKHVLLPIWISAYRYNGKVYRFMVNGRTGEVQGERPWSWIKITLAILFVLALVIGAVYLFGENKQGTRTRHRYRNENIRTEQKWMSFQEAESNLNCKKFHNGSFKMVSSVNNNITYFLTRKGDIQIEKKGNDPNFPEIQFAVDWVSNCTYTLFPTVAPQSFIESWGDKKLFVEIIETGKDYYIARSKKEGYGELIQRIEKVKK